MSIMQIEIWRRDDSVAGKNKQVPIITPYLVSNSIRCNQTGQTRLFSKPYKDEKSMYLKKNKKKEIHYSQILI